jgi:hypothetical protein
VPTPQGVGANFLARGFSRRWTVEVPTWKAPSRPPTKHSGRRSNAARFRMPRFITATNLRLAWIYIRQSDPDTAADRAGASIRRYARRHGVGDRYHDTLSRAWVRIVALAMTETAGAAGFEDLLAARPHLLDKRLPLKHSLGSDPPAEPSRLTACRPVV